MGHVHRFGSAFVFATALAVGMMASTASLEAAKPSSREAICKYLDSVINYPNVSPYILSWAIALYNHYDCDKVL